MSTWMSRRSFGAPEQEFWSKLPQVAITVPGTSPFVARARSQPAVEEMSLCIYIDRYLVSVRNFALSRIYSFVFLVKPRLVCPLIYDGLFN